MENIALNTNFSYTNSPDLLFNSYYDSSYNDSNLSFDSCHGSLYDSSNPILDFSYGFSNLFFENHKVDNETQIRNESINIIDYNMGNYQEENSEYYCYLLIILICYII